jgi:TPP-dependent pyruvate/acetoin dehydrogenase alpha subunit
MTSSVAESRLRCMLTARRFDETLIEHVGLVHGVFHVGMGQEGTAAAIALERQSPDVLMLNHRSHHHLIAGGAAPETLFAEIFGRDLGPHRGRNGTLHLADPACGVGYTSAMVGGTVPLGLGMALARKRRGDPGIAFCCFGDGAFGEGILHECLNVAKLWELPVVFVCESNSEPGPGRATSAQAAASLTDLAAAHQVVASRVDATDAAAVHQALSAIAADVRSGAGPRFLLAQTVPWPGNNSFIPSLPDGPLNLSRAEHEPFGWEAHDPILGEVRILLRAGASLSQLLTQDAAIRDAIQRAVSTAAAAGLAPPEAAFENVWADQ